MICGFLENLRLKTAERNEDLLVLIYMPYSVRTASYEFCAV